MTKLDARPITIGLLWHSASSDNLGVGALTASQIAICQAAAMHANVVIRFIVFGTEGGRNYILANEPSVRLGGRVSIKQILLARSDFVKDIGQCDLVLDIGEGDSFTDIYGLKRLLFLCISKFVVLIKAKPLILSPQTIGPFNRWLPRIITNQMMRHCKQVFARDALSYQYLTDNGIVSNVQQVIDVAFRLPYTPPSPSSSTRIKIGLNVSGLLFSGGYTQNNQFGLTIDYPELIRQLLTRWLQRVDYEVWLIPHVVPDNMPVEDDRRAIQVLQQAFPQVHCAPDFATPSEAKAFIAGMDFMTGARMHACIAAFSSGVPVVPVAYSRKFNGLFQSLKYRWFADGKSMTTEQVVDLIEQGLANRALLKQEVLAGNAIASRLLLDYEQYLSLCMRGLRT